MRAQLASRAGTAILWTTVSLLGARGISLVRFFILAWILDPADFGLLAIAAVALELLLAFTDVGMAPALVQQRGRDERAYDAAWTVEFVRASAVFAAVLIAAPAIAQLFGEPRATDILRGLALGSFIATLSSVRVADLTRDLHFRALGLMGLATPIVEAVVSISLAPALGVWALVVGTVSAAATGTVLSYVVAPYRPRLAFRTGMAKRLFAFGRWVFVTNIVFVLGDAVLRAVVSRQLGTAELGLYYVAFRLAFLPQSIVSGVIRPVAFPVFAQVQEDERRAVQTYRLSVTAMFGLLLPIYTLLIVLAPLLISDVLGPRWAGAVPIVQVLGVAAFIGLITECTIPLVLGLGRPQFGMLLFGLRSALVIGLVWWLASNYGLVGAAIAWLVAEVVVQGVAILTARRVLPGSFTGLRPPLAAVTWASIAGGVLAWAIARQVSGLVGVVVASVPAVALIGGLLFVLDRRFDLGFIKTLVQAFPGFPRFGGRSGGSGHGASADRPGSEPETRG